jgi:hypothetical protein
LEVRVRDSKRVENNLAQKYESNSHTKGCEDAQKRLTSSLLGRSIASEPCKYRHQSDWVDSDKDRNKSQDKLLGHRF